MSDPDILLVLQMCWFIWQLVVLFVNGVNLTGQAFPCLVNAFNILSLTLSQRMTIL